MTAGAAHLASPARRGRPRHRAALAAAALACCLAAPTTAHEQPSSRRVLALVTEEGASVGVYFRPSTQEQRALAAARSAMPGAWEAAQRLRLASAALRDVAVWWGSGAAECQAMAVETEVDDQGALAVAVLLACTPPARARPCAGVDIVAPGADIAVTLGDDGAAAVWYRDAAPNQRPPCIPPDVFGVRRSR